MAAQAPLRRQREQATQADEDDERRNRLTDAYNRAFRGYTIPQYSDAPLPIARWADRGVRRSIIARSASTGQRGKRTT